MDTVQAQKQNKLAQPKLPRPIWIEPKTFQHWAACGAITVTEQGEENTYGVDEFGLVFFAKLEG